MIQNFKHIVITGASSGIGKALALHYADSLGNIRLSLGGRNAERLEAVAKDCIALGADVDIKTICVTRAADMEAWLHSIDAQTPVDLIIANAGISAGTGTQGGVEQSQQVRDIFAVNVAGVFNTIHPLQDKMVARGHGHIAIMASIAGFRGLSGAPAYCGSKAAVKVYGEGLRGALHGTGVKVHVILPGFVKSGITDANDFPMPFIMGAPRAASIIARGIQRGHGRIAFPLPMVFVAWFLSILPDSLAYLLTKSVPAKSTSIEQ